MRELGGRVVECLLPLRTGRRADPQFLERDKHAMNAGLEEVALKVGVFAPDRGGVPVPELYGLLEEPGSFLRAPSSTAYQVRAGGYQLLNFLNLLRPVLERRQDLVDPQSGMWRTH